MLTQRWEQTSVFDVVVCEQEVADQRGVFSKALVRCALVGSVAYDVGQRRTQLIVNRDELCRGGIENRVG